MISVIIPVYNAEKYIEECAESVLTQSYRDLELILVDDGSRDNSLSLCHEIAENDSRVRVLTQSNSGPNMARRRGIETATGEFIVFLDADDYFALPNTLQTAVEAFGIDPCIDIVSIPQWREWDNGSVTRKNPQPQLLTDRRTIFLNWYNGNLIEGAFTSKLYRREVFDGWEIDPDIRFTEDHYVIPDMLARTRAVYIGNQGAYFYRANPQSAIHSHFTLSKRFDMLRSQTRLYATLLTMPDTEKERQHFYSVMLENSFYLIATPEYCSKALAEFTPQPSTNILNSNASKLQKLLYIATRTFGKRVGLLAAAKTAGLFTQLHKD